MDKLTAIKIKHPNGQYSDPILLSVKADNVQYDDTRGLKDKIQEMESRVNDILTPTPGSTSFDQEIEDARKGADIDPATGERIDYGSLYSSITTQHEKSLNTVLVRKTQPTERENKLWIDKSTSGDDEVQILTIDDLDIIAPIYNENSTYATGDYVVYDGSLYRCNTDIETAETWTVAHWTGTNISEKLIDIDKTLTVADMAADAEVVGDEIADLKSAFATLMKSENFDFSVLDLNTFIINNKNKWAGAGSGGQGRSYLIPVNNAKRLILTTNSTSGTRIAFLKNDSHNIGETPDYSDAYTESISISTADTEYEYIIPSDTNYIYVTAITSTGSVITPTVVFEYVTTDTTLTESNIPADAKIVGENLSTLEGNLKSTIEYSNDVIGTEIGLIPYTAWEPGSISTNVDPIDINTVTPGTQSRWLHIVIPCVQGDIFNLNISKGSVNARPYAIIDVNGNILDIASMNTINMKVAATAANAAYVVCNVRLDEGLGLHEVSKGAKKVTALESNLAELESNLAELESNLAGLESNLAGLESVVKPKTTLSKINDHLYEIKPEKESGFIQYKNEDGSIVPTTDEFIGTDFLAAPKYLCLNFRDTTTRIMVYFFDKVNEQYVPRWDVLKLEASTHILNYLAFRNSRNRVIEIPEGLYIKICVAVEGDYSIYGWDGIHFGGEISGETYGPYLINESTGKYTLHTFVNSNTFFTVSGKAKQIIMKDAMAVSIFGRDANGDYEKLSYAGTENPFIQVFDVPAGYEWISVSATIGVEYDKYADGHPDQNNLNTPTNLNDYVSVVNGVNISTRPYGRAADVFDVAEKIVNIKWRNLQTTRIANDDSATNDYNKFRRQAWYTGIPYSSEWMSVHWFGWHISKHTFLNATNDLGSRFYAETDRKGNSYGYGLVCSTFTGLCEGWPVPFVNYSMLHEPSLHSQITNQPLIGSTTQHVGAGHCVLPESVGQNSNNDYDFYTIYECVSPLTLRRTNYSFKGKTGNTVRAWGYMRDFIRAYTHDNASPGTTPYNITDGSITGGTARPYCGDRGVLTSATGVKINIYDANATTLYLQKCTYNKSTKVFTPTGAAQSIAISAGETQITVDPTLLIDNSFYAVYTDADNTPEYFEYHIVETETYSTNGSFAFSRNDFWYICFWETDTAEGKTEIIPVSDDYSAYYEAYHPQGNSGTMFFKGILGAYCTTVIYQD